MKAIVIIGILATVTFCLVIGLQVINTVMFSVYSGAASHYSLELFKSLR
jgi:hypothetical protein